jgi:ribosomal protein S18 acetylase RimI-like enzyme
VTAGELRIERARLPHLDALLPLFVAYRHFYERPDDPRTRGFLEQRMRRDESVVFLASLEGAAVGFTQLYPSFASVSLCRMFVLYDLFVVPHARRHGVAAALLRTAVDYAREQGAGELMLQTATGNLAAQGLYEREGWVRDKEFYVYNYYLPAPAPSPAPRKVRQAQVSPRRSRRRQRPAPTPRRSR